MASIAWGLLNVADLACVSLFYLLVVAHCLWVLRAEWCQGGVSTLIWGMLLKGVAPHLSSLSTRL
jgi:hypothetical protein